MSPGFRRYLCGMAAYWAAYIGALLLYVGIDKGNAALVAPGAGLLAVSASFVATIVTVRSKP